MKVPRYIFIIVSRLNVKMNRLSFLTNLQLTTVLKWNENITHIREHIPINFYSYFFYGFTVGNFIVIVYLFIYFRHRHRCVMSYIFSANNLNSHNVVL